MKRTRADGFAEKSAVRACPQVPTRSPRLQHHEDLIIRWHWSLPSCRCPKLSYLLKFSENFGMTFGEMMNDTHVFDQATKIPSRQDKIEVIGAIFLLDQFELTIEIGRLALHALKLVIGQAFTRFPLPADKFALLTRSYQ